MKKKAYPEAMKKHAAKELKTFQGLVAEEKKMQKKMGSKKAAHSKKSGY